MRALGDLGADVIRVEEVAPGSGRRGGASLSDRPPPLLHEEPSQRRHLGERNVRRIALDLKSDTGLELFFRLVSTAAVVVEGFRPGVAQRLGIDYERCRQANEAIVYVSLSGYGQHGPYAARVGHDANYLATGGVLSMTGLRDGPPVLPGFPAADHAAGAMSAIAHILAALLHRERYGKGGYLDVAITDAVAALETVFVEEYFETGVTPARGATGISGLWPWYGVYPTRDDRWVSVAAIEPFFYAGLCDAIGRPDLATLQWEQDQWDNVRAQLEQTFAQRSLDEWKELFTQDICVAPVLDIDEVVADPHLRHRNVIQQVAHPDHGQVTVVGPVVRLGDGKLTVRRWARTRGQDTGEVLEELGLSRQDVADLETQRIVGRHTDAQPAMSGTSSMGGTS